MVMSELPLSPVQAPLRHWLAGDWLDDDTLRPLSEINLRCVQLLAAQAAVAAGGGRGNGLAATELRPLWKGLDERALQRLAGCPYSLVDVGFADPERWRGVQHGAVNDLPRAAGCVCFDAGGGQILLRQVLMYGWHLARAHRQVARVVFGMTPAVAASVAALSLQELDRIADRYVHWLRPRWDSRPQIWKLLLTGAGDTGNLALQQATLHGLQLIAGDRLAVAGTEARAQ
jgi:hypothetical protein